MDSDLSGQGVAEGNSSTPYQLHNLETVTEEEDDSSQGWPLLVEDGTKSQLCRPLTRLLLQLDQVQRAEPTPFDVLFTIVYCVGLESGYIPAGHKLAPNQLLTRFVSFDRRILTIFSKTTLPNFYSRESRSFRLDLTLNPDYQLCSLIGIKSGDFLILTLTIPARSSSIPGRSLFLPVSRYVPLLNFQKLPLCCQNLKELSHKLKNGLFIPIRDELCQEAALYPSLNGLPDEVVALLVRRYLTKKDCARLGASCGRLRELVRMYRAR